MSARLGPDRPRAGAARSACRRRRCARSRSVSMRRKCSTSSVSAGARGSRARLVVAVVRDPLLEHLGRRLLADRRARDVARASRSRKKSTNRKQQHADARSRSRRRAGARRRRASLPLPQEGDDAGRHDRERAAPPARRPASAPAGSTRARRCARSAGSMSTYLHGRQREAGRLHVAHPAVVERVVLAVEELDPGALALEDRAHLADQREALRAVRRASFMREEERVVARVRRSSRCWGRRSSSCAQRRPRAGTGSSPDRDSPRSSPT